MPLSGEGTRLEDRIKVPDMIDGGFWTLGENARSLYVKVKGFLTMGQLL